MPPAPLQFVGEAVGAFPLSPGHAARSPEWRGLARGAVLGLLGALVVSLPSLAQTTIQRAFINSSI